MNSFEKIKKKFEEFPGIGPRQAERFAYFLLSRNSEYLEELKHLISTLKDNVFQCKECMRFFSSSHGASLCSICSDIERDKTTLMIVAKDNDLHTIEKSNAFKGMYFVLGGIIPILEKSPERRIRLTALTTLLQKNKDIKEVIFALSATHEGEHTENYLTEIIHTKNPSIHTSHLGRGLSTGLEIEYSDSDTIRAALKNKY